MADTITLTDNRTGKAIDLPLIQGTDGAPVLDIRSLHTQLGCFTFDPGFLATASTESTITYIDGGEGILRYRGYPIEQLAERSTYLEVAYLLVYGELPNPRQLDEFRYSITHHTMMHESLKQFFDGFHYDAHPMAMMVGVIGSLSAFYHGQTDINDPEDRMLAAHRIIAKVPTIAAACYKHAMGEPMVYPDNRLSYSANLMHMLFSVPSEHYEISQTVKRTMDLLFILHADHEQNASTSTVRLAGSSGTDPFTCIAAGCASLWGPAHGGANEAVLRMLEEIGDTTQVPHFLDRAKDKDDPFRLMGFGHRVYKNYDPRAKLIREACHDLLEELQIDNPLLELAMRLEEIALQDEYFIERKLYPNVDFYSGIIYKALGLPTSMFTPMLAIARTSGWISHWMEMVSDPAMRIGRPRQIYTGAAVREYVPMSERG